MSLDPFTIAYNALWALAEAHAPLAALVRLGNRIKFTASAEDQIGGRDPVKDTVTTADLPELRLIPSGMRLRKRAGSSGFSVERSFQWGIASGQKLLDADGNNIGLFPIEWELLRAMADVDRVMQAVEFAGSTKILHAIPVLASEGVVDADLQRNIGGWSALWQIDVEMAFRLTDMPDNES